MDRPLVNARVSATRETTLAASIGTESKGAAAYFSKVRSAAR
jgi:hypothetical protein